VRGNAGWRRSEDGGTASHSASSRFDGLDVENSRFPATWTDGSPGSNALAAELYAIDSKSMAVDAVWLEPVSACISLPTGKLTANSPFPGVF
jgi:hypothetical protein